MKAHPLTLFASILTCCVAPAAGFELDLAPAPPAATAPDPTALAGTDGGEGPDALDLEARVECHRALEEVRWSFRTWPSANPGPKPRLADVLPESELRRRAERTVLLSNALDRGWHRPVRDAQLRAELGRMARDTQAPDQLAALERALGGDAYLLAECLARPILVERLARSYFRNGSGTHVADEAPRSLEAWVDEHRGELGLDLVTDPRAWEDWTLPPPRGSARGLVGDSWTPTAALPEASSGFSLVWTGAEMIVWGGGKRDTGSRYDPATDSWTATAAVGAPSPRTEHAAVWTGVEMIVWGGCGQLQDFCEVASGGRYDPIADSWTPLPASPVSARRLHTAVWTGSEMIVWGGCVTGSFGNNACEIELGSAGRYDPAANSWSAASTAGEPAPRTHHRAVWTGSEMIVWGGHPGAGVTDTGGRYDPISDSWSPTSTASAPSPRSAHAAVWTGTEMIVWGGCDNVLCAVGDTRLGDGARYDPATDGWSPVSLLAAPVPRTGHAAVWSGGEMILWGGQGQNFERLDTGGRYDPLADDWTPTTTTNAPPGRAGHGAVWTGTEMIVWGQLDAQGRKSGGRYDPVTDSWVPTSLNDPRNPRRNHVAVWTGAEKLVWGGDLVGAFGGVGNRYEPATDNWTPMAEAGEPLEREEGLAAVWSGTEMIVWGGKVGTFLHDTGGRYDPTSDSWQDTSTVGAPSPRAYTALVWSGTRMIVWGGSTDVPPFSTNTGGRYDPATDSWTPTSLVDVPPAARFPTGVWTGSRAIFWGGAAVAGDFDTGGVYDPVTNAWTPVSTTGAPSPRHFHTALWTGSRMLVWGGMDGSFDNPTYLSSGGLYDPATDGWTPTALGGAPSGRVRHTAVWTGREAIVWGGCNGPSNCGTGLFSGARYDPQTDLWTPTPTQSVPGARDGHSAVWTGSRMIVWSGLADSYGSYTSTGGLYLPPLEAIFADGFESGDTGAWTLTIP